MSHINDALKRAKKAQRPTPQNPPPTEPLSPTQTGSSHFGMGWLFLIILFIAIAGFFIGLAFASHKSSPQLAVAASAAQMPAPTPMASNPVAPPLPPPPTTNVAAPVPKPAPPPPPPLLLKLQGIFFNATAPQAIVNGRTVYVGDMVNGFQLKTISPNSVSFVAPDGTLKTLVLNE